MTKPLTVLGAFGAVLIAATAAPVEAQTLRLAHPFGWGGSESLDPISPVRFYELNQLIYSRLVRQNVETGRPEPDLAEAWEATPDAKVWTFTLRDGVSFHDGSALTAEDVVFSLLRTQSETIDSPTKGVMGIIEAAEAVDDRTVKVTLKSSHADFPLLVMDYRIRIVSKAACGGDLDALCESGVGTGPFKLASLDVEGTSVLERFDEFWAGPAGVETVEIIAIADQEARIAALQAGQIDIVFSLTNQQKPLFANNPNFVMQSVPTGRWVGFAMNTTEEPFTDARVRKAMRMAVDRETMGQLVYGAGGYVVTCDHPVWSGDQYRAEIDCPQDIDGAKALLAEAGHADGLAVELFVSDISEGAVRMAEVYQAQVAEAGIDVALNLAPSDGYWTDTWMKEPFVATAWSQRPADQILNEAYRSGAAWNESFWTVSEFDAALDAAREELDFETRKELYGDLQRQLFEEGGTFIPVHLNSGRAFSAKISGLPPVEDFTIRFEDIHKAE
ncbi:MAG: ABC transporter substrate-binding protein [Paracoccaceae bacterium]